MLTPERLCSITIQISPTMSEKMRQAAVKRGLPYHVFCRLLFEAAWLAYVKPPSGDDGLDDMVARAVSAAAAAKVKPAPVESAPAQPASVRAAPPAPPKIVQVAVAVPMPIMVPLPVPVLVPVEVERMVEVEKVVERVSEPEPQPVFTIHGGKITPETLAAIEALVRAAVPIMAKVRGEKDLASAVTSAEKFRKAVQEISLQPMAVKMPVHAKIPIPTESAPEPDGRLNAIQARLVCSYQAAGMTVAEIAKETGYSREAIQKVAGRK